MGHMTQISHLSHDTTNGTCVKKVIVYSGYEAEIWVLTAGNRSISALCELRGFFHMTWGVPLGFTPYDCRQHPMYCLWNANTHSAGLLGMATCVDRDRCKGRARKGLTVLHIRLQGVSADEVPLQRYRGVRGLHRAIDRTLCWCSIPHASMHHYRRNATNPRVTGSKLQAKPNIPYADTHTSCTATSGPRKAHPFYEKLLQELMVKAIDLVKNLQKLPML